MYDVRMVFVQMIIIYDLSAYVACVGHVYRVRTNKQTTKMKRTKSPLLKLCG